MEGEGRIGEIASYAPRGNSSVLDLIVRRIADGASRLGSTAVNDSTQIRQWAQQVLDAGTARWVAAHRRRGGQRQEVEMAGLREGN